MALFFLLKYKNPELYNKKLLIVESIYKPYLYENYTYDSFTFKENSDCFKGGIYCVVKSKEKQKYFPKYEHQERNELVDRFLREHGIYTSNTKTYLYNQ